jgi:two-component system sensor histidine kinase AtoS
MKKKIIIVLAVSSVIFIMAGIYIALSIAKTTSDLDSLIRLHQVEILREHLLIRIKRVQADLSLKGTRYARGIDTITGDVVNMAAAVDICFTCHHSEEGTQRLVDLKEQIHEFKDGLSRVLTIRANTARLVAEEDNAFKIGEELVTRVNTMIALTQRRLNERTESALVKMARTKMVLIALVASGPLLAGALGFIFIRSFTRPVSELLTATRKLKGGDLSYRVGHLKDEFGEVAQSFNEMAGSLSEQMERIEENEKRYRTLFESAGDAIFILETEGENRFRIVAANPAAAAMHGYAVDELKTMKITDLNTPEYAEIAPEVFQAVMRGERIKTELQHRRKEGTTFPVEMSAGLLEMAGHNYVLAFDRDISERKKAEEAIQRAEQVRMVGDLAAGLTHELKNSLAGIKISIEVLLDEVELSAEDREVLTNMLQEIRRIELLMKDLLNFARPSKPQFTFVNVNAVLDIAMTFSLKNVGVSTEGRSPITSVRDFDERLPKTMADPMQLQQIFMNLLMNAVESMSEGGTITVKTEYEPVGGEIRITISDTGKGIADEMMVRVFEPFFTTKPKGTGLGLAISKRLVEQHGGSIHFENNEAGGATFRIILPVKHFDKVYAV